MTTNTNLRTKLEAFRVDAEGTEFTFVDRLAHENGWSKAFAAGAFAEYKRFVYLAAVCGREVTPSDIVDQVWHLHLTFTRSYWTDLCGKVIERPLHHNPTKGGKAERTRFREQYDATLALYRAEFGHDAPEAYWPPANARFASFAHQAWVDRRTHWVVAKPNWRVWAVGAGATLAATGTAAAAEDGKGETIGAIVIGAVLAVVAVLLFAIITSARAGRRRSSRGDDGTTAAWIPISGGSGSKKDGGEGGEGGEGGDGGGGDGGSGCSGGGCGGGSS